MSTIMLYCTSSIGFDAVLLITGITISVWWCVCESGLKKSKTCWAVDYRSTWFKAITRNAAPIPFEKNEKYSTKLYRMNFDTIATLYRKSSQER